MGQVVFIVCLHALYSELLLTICTCLVARQCELVQISALESARYLTARQLLGMKPIYGAEFTLEALRNRRLVTDDVVKLFKILRQSRNFIAHGMVNDISAEEAASYYGQSSIVLESVRQAIAKLRHPG